MANEEGSKRRFMFEFVQPRLAHDGDGIISECKSEIIEADSKEQAEEAARKFLDEGSVSFEGHVYRRSGMPHRPLRELFTHQVLQPRREFLPMDECDRF